MNNADFCKSSSSPAEGNNLDEEDTEDRDKCESQCVWLVVEEGWMDKISQMRAALEKKTHVVAPSRVDTGRRQLVNSRVQQMNECSSNLEFTMSMMIGLREDEAGTHDDTATKVLCKVKDALGDREVLDAAREHGEERAEHGAGEDDEDRGDAQAGAAGVAAALAAVDVAVVVAREERGHVFAAGEDHGGVSG